MPHLPLLETEPAGSEPVDEHLGLAGQYIQRSGAKSIFVPDMNSAIRPSDFRNRKSLDQ